MTKKDPPEAPSELGKYDARFWLREIAAAKLRNNDWYEDADEAEARYRDEDERGYGSLNIFWANVETQKAAIGEDFGKPEVRRVNAPEDDGGLARHVAMIWERAIAAAVRDTNDNHDVGLAVGDVFVPGRGALWCELDAGEEDENGEPKWAKAPIVRVPARDFLTGEATRWGSVPWAARAHEFTRDELVDVCGQSEEQAKKIPLNVEREVATLAGEKLSKRDRDQFKRARVWEIFTTFPEKLRLYVAEGFGDRVLLCEADPYKLKNFFPCPRPMQANGDEAKPPLTDLSRYEDQAAELDRVCERIFILTDLLRNRGAYDKRFKELADLMKSEDNVFLPIEDWAELQAKGGLLSVIQAMDLETISVVIDRLRQQRRDLIELIYELSGVSDLARGQTDPQETLGAQKLKKSFGSGRFRARETESRRLAAEAYTIKGEIIAEHFPRRQLEEMSGIRMPLREEIDAAKAALKEIETQQQRQAQAAAMQAQQTGQPPQPPAPPAIEPEELEKLQKMAAIKWSWEDVSGVLTSDYRRCYSCEVETDQSRFVDEEADKAAVTQLFQVIMQTLEQVAPMIGTNPKVGEVWKTVVMFVISRFKAGRSLEEGLERVIEEAIQMATQQAGQPQAEDPKIAADKALAEAKVKAAELGLQRTQMQLEIEKLRAQNAGAQEMAKAQSEQAKTQAKAQQEQIKTEASATQANIKQVEGAQKVQTQQDLNQAKRAGHLIQLQNQKETAEFQAQTRATAEQALLKGKTRAPARAAT